MLVERYMVRQEVYDRRRSEGNAGFVDDVVADESIRFMHQAVDKDRPFVLWMCTQVPHMDHKAHLAGC